MLVVPLLIIAICSQAIATEPTVSTKVDDDASEMNDEFMLSLLENGIAKEYPILYKIVDKFRECFGISKDKMMKFGMKAVELMSTLGELWELKKDMWKREVSKNQVKRNTNADNNSKRRFYTNYGSHIYVKDE